MSVKDETPSTEPRDVWKKLIPDEQWEIYKRVMDKAQERGLAFSLGGAFSVAAYTGQWRNTKDLDIYVLPADHEAMVEVVKEAGLSDYYDELPYDRGWIFRGHEGDIIVDVIWAMSNRRADVDEAWIHNGLEIEVRNEDFRVVPAEEMIWGKIYIIHRDRCDWTDVLNLIYHAGPSLDWKHLLERLGEDEPLLRGVLSVFAWLCPGRAHELPEWLWEALHLPLPEQREPDIDRERVDLLDTRDWFYPLVADDEVAPL